MEQWNIAVIGAGASGLIAAYQAAKALGPGSVLLLEGNPKPGKKLLATGNGRCNLTNLHIAPQHYHGDVALAAPLLARYPAQRVMDAFGGMGLLCRADGEGRVYPNNLQAAAVLQTLWDACREAGVTERWAFPCREIRPEKGGFLLHGPEGQRLFARQCILACGGQASPKHSCPGGGYALAEALGLPVTGLRPSLVPLKSPAKALRSLKGMRCKARAALYCQGEAVYAESGEVLFGDGALSGICIFNLSARLGETAPAGLEVSLDLLEAMEEAQVLAYLKGLRAAHPQRPAGELFAGALNLRVGWELVKSLNIPGDKPLSRLGDRDLARAAGLAKDWRFPVTGPGPWESAQVTAGGVPLREVDPETLESKKHPGLYVTGELLNIDGDCGGYNLHWAWATGLAAGTAAAQQGKEGERC